MHGFVWEKTIPPARRTLLFQKPCGHLGNKERSILTLEEIEFLSNFWGGKPFMEVIIISRGEVTVSHPTGMSPPR